MPLKGNVHKYGANIDTDVIIPARYLNQSEPSELAKHCMEDKDPDFVKKLRKGDFIVATSNFGCGSSREHAPISIKAAGVSAIIAKSFARIFYRNSINIGLPVLECPEAADEAEAGDLLQIELSSGEIRNLTKEKAYHAKPYPKFMLDIINAGGLVEYTKRKIATGGKA